MIARREFVLVAGAFALSGMSSLRVQGQPIGKVYRVGILGFGNHPANDRDIAAFRERLGQLGYVEGRNLQIELRAANRQADRLPALRGGTGSPERGRDRNDYDAGGAGGQGSDGGNITGLFLDLPALAGKWLELLETAAPGRRRIGLLWDSTTGSTQLDAAKAAAARFDLDLRIVEFHNSDDMDEALRNAVSKGARAMVMLSSPTVSANSKQLAEFMVRNRLPAISPFRGFADGGGLLSYGPNLTVFRRVAASYVDSILKGAKPSDLPIHQPTTFELVINLKTAKALGITIPQSLLLRADEVIQ